MENGENDGAAVPPPHCSFCGRNQKDVRLLIAAKEAHICDQCVAICSGMVAVDLWDLGETFPDRPWLPKHVPGVGSIHEVKEDDAPEA